MNQEKKVFFTLVGVVLISMMAGTVSLGAENVTITLWGWDIQPQSVSEQAYIFQIEHPNVKVDAVNMGYRDVQTKVVTSLLAGVGAPDIFFADIVMIGNYIKLGGMLDLTKEMMPLRDYIAETWLEGCTGPEGKIWAFPWDGGIATVFYRKEVFDKAGLKSPDTWDGFIDAGKKLTVDKDGDGEIDQYMLALTKTGGTLAAFYQMFTQSKGIPMTNASGDLLFDSEPCIEVFQWIADLALKHKIAEVVKEMGPAAPGYWDAFKKGRYVCSISGSWAAGFGLKRLGYNPEHEWRVAPWPSWEKGEKTGAIWGGSGAMIPEQTKHPKEAIAFAKFISATRGAQMYIWKKYDKFPVFTPVWDLIYDVSDPFFGGQKTMKIWIDELKATPRMTYGPYWSQIDSGIREILPDMLMGKISAHEALSLAKEKVESLIK